MKKIIFLIFILILITNISFAQLKTKRIKTKSGDLKEVYYVLKDSMLIKHGKYKKSVSNGFHQIGQYNNNKRCGIWNTYEYERILFSYDYDKNKVLIDVNNECLNDVSYYHGTIPPYILNTIDYFYLIRKNYNLQLIAREIWGNGTVVVKITIDSTGAIKNYEINKSVKKAIDDEAIKILKTILSQLKFMPGVKDGESVESSICIPLSFFVK